MDGIPAVGFNKLQFTEPDVMPMIVTAPDGRRAFLEIKDGGLVRGGDLPADEAAWMFMEVLCGKWVELNCPRPRAHPMNPDRITGQRAGIRWAIAFLHKRAGVYEHPMARRAVKESAKVLAIAAKMLRTKELPTEGWQDIATAPRDGTNIILAGRWPEDAQYWVGEGWFDRDAEGWWVANSHPSDAWDGQVYPTHWQPLPPPPDTEDDITAGLEALSEPIVAEWGEVKDRLNLGKED